MSDALRDCAERLKLGQHPVQMIQIIGCRTKLNGGMHMGNAQAALLVASNGGGNVTLDGFRIPVVFLNGKKQGVAQAIANSGGKKLGWRGTFSFANGRRLIT